MSPPVSGCGGVPTGRPVGARRRRFLCCLRLSARGPIVAMVLLSVAFTQSPRCLSGFCFSFPELSGRPEARLFSELVQLLS